MSETWSAPLDISHRDPTREHRKNLRVPAAFRCLAPHGRHISWLDSNCSSRRTWARRSRRGGRCTEHRAVFAAVPARVGEVPNLPPDKTVRRTHVLDKLLRMIGGRSAVVFELADP